MALPDLTTDGDFHASAVAFNARAVLILGASGSGKSSLALSLMALGADLVADDRVALTCRDGVPWASAPDALPDLIEARGVGLLNATRIEGAWVSLVVDMGSVEPDRHPSRRDVSVLGMTLPLVQKVDGPHFPAAILQYLKHGRSVE
jgi:HPr kinase/phosphorylase